MGLILVGASLQASAYKLGHLIAGRVVTGFGTGIDSSTVPMYQSELSKKEWRGRLVSWEIWFIGKIVVLFEGCRGHILTLVLRPRDQLGLLDRLRLLLCRQLSSMADTHRHPTRIRCRCHLCYLGLSRVATLVGETWTLGGSRGSSLRRSRPQARRSIHRG